MSSHWDWAKKVIKLHNEEKKFAPENGEPLKFKIGDKVTCINSCGVLVGPFRITGYYQPEEIDCHYALGERYILDWDCYWVTVKESQLKHAE